MDQYKNEDKSKTKSTGKKCQSTSKEKNMYSVYTSSDSFSALSIYEPYQFQLFPMERSDKKKKPIGHTISCNISLVQGNIVGTTTSSF